MRDIDGDGKPDIEFYSESPRIEFGVHTSSGATVVLTDGLAGPATHSGWIRRGFNGQVLAVLDDGRDATLHAFVNCRFVTPFGTNHKPYSFTLAGFGTHGTGVACTEPVGQSWIAGVQATRRGNGHYDLATTQVTVSPNGTVATNSAAYTFARNLPATDFHVRAAMTSSCATVTKVHTSGR